jgi:hypothetical protein
MPCAPAGALSRRGSAADCIPHTLRHNVAALPRADLEKLGPLAGIWLCNSNVTHRLPPFVTQRRKGKIGRYNGKFSTVREAWVRRQGQQLKHFRTIGAGISIGTARVEPRSARPSGSDTARRSASKTVPGEATRAAVHPCSPLPLRPAASQPDLAAINDKAMTAIVPNQRLHQDE